MRGLRLGLGLTRPSSGAAAFAPASLTFSTSGVWLDPSDLTTLYQTGTRASPGAAVAADGDPVGLMLDKSGNQIDLLQSASTKRPLYKIDGSGKPYLLFDGVDDFLTAASWTIALPYDRLTALQQIVWASGAHIWSTSSTLVARVFGNVSSPTLRLMDGTTTNSLLTSGATVGANAVLIERHVANASQLAVNSGAFGAAVDAGATSPSALGLTIAAQNPGTSGWDNFRFYGAIIAPQLGSSDLANAKTWLGAKASLTL